MHSGRQPNTNSDANWQHEPPQELTKGERVEEHFRQLFQNEMTRSAQSVETVAKKLGMTRRKFQRIIYGQTKITAANLVEIGDALAIDKSRATIAVERFQDWRCYYDPALMIAVDLIKPVVEMINHLSTTSLEPLHPKAAEQLSKRVAETVIKHQIQLCARREKLDNDGQPEPKH